MNTLWLSPTAFVTGDPTLRISYPFVSHPSTIVACTQPGDFKWVSMGVPLPPDVMIEEVVICYQVTSDQSFISQVRLAEMGTPDQALVRHDDPTDLTSTSPTRYRSYVGGLIPTAAVSLELRLNFQNTTDQILLGAVGVTIRPALQTCLNVADFGAIGDGASHPLHQRYVRLADAQVDYPAATDLQDETDWAALQGAINAAQTHEPGTCLLVPAPAVEYVVNKELRITHPSLTVRAPACIGTTVGSTSVNCPIRGVDCSIRQHSSLTPVFDVRADGVTIEGFYLRYTGARVFNAGIPSSKERGGAAYVDSAGVWSNGHRLTVRRLRVYGFTCGVVLSNWNEHEKKFTRLVEGCVVDDLLVDTVDFGLLAQGQSRTRVRGVRGRYVESTVPENSPRNPPHLIYWSVPDETHPPEEASLSRDVHVDACSAWGGRGGHAYIFRGVTSGQVGTLRARDCDGILSLRNCQNMVFDVLNSQDEGVAEGTGSVYFQGHGEQRITINTFTVSVSMVPQFDAAGKEVIARRLLRLDGTDCVVERLYARTIRNRLEGDQPLNTAEVTVQGMHNQINHARIENVGTGGAWAIDVAGGKEHVIRDLAAKNVAVGLIVRYGAVNCTVDVVLSHITLAAGIKGAKQVDVLEPSTVQHIVP